MLHTIPVGLIEYNKQLRSFAGQIARKYPRLEKNRIYRAIDVIIEGRIKNVGQDVWSVTPASGVPDFTYVVEPGKCSCPDNLNGHVCKHRLAAFMLTELDKQKKPEGHGYLCLGEEF